MFKKNIECFRTQQILKKHVQKTSDLLKKIWSQMFAMEFDRRKSIFDLAKITTKCKV